MGDSDKSLQSCLIKLYRYSDDELVVLAKFKMTTLK